MFDNARLYNKPGSDVHVMANTLQVGYDGAWRVCGLAGHCLRNCSLHKHSFWTFTNAAQPTPFAPQERFEERYSATVSARVAEEAALARHQQEEARRRHAEAGARGSTEALEQYCSVRAWGGMLLFCSRRAYEVRAVRLWLDRGAGAVLLGAWLGETAQQCWVAGLAFHVAVL